MTPLVDVSSLTVHAGSLSVVSDVSFAMNPGERTGLIGESGSGKTMTALAILGLLPPSMKASGSIQIHGQEVIAAPERALIPLRGVTVAMVFQEPLTALDPLMRVGKLIAEPLLRTEARRGRKLDRGQLKRRVVEALVEVAIPDPERVRRAFPHELSGGQRQRVALAMALACKPKLLIADEPTTALDVTIQAEILGLLRRVVNERNMSLLFIGHDLPVVSSITDRLIVLKEGLEVERGETRGMLTEPKHAYTKSLVAAARRFDSVLEASKR